METKIKNCRHCGAEMEIAFSALMARFANDPVSCDQCAAIHREAAKQAGIMAILRELAPRSALTPDDGRLDRAKAFCEAFPKSMDGKLNLFLSGPCRTGKTYFAWQLIKSALLNGRSVGSLSGTLFEVSQLAQLSSPDVLLFDEFSKVDFMDKPSMKFIFNLINARTEAQKITIFVSNITISDLEEVATKAAPMMAPSIFARINESKIARVIK